MPTESDNQAITSPDIQSPPTSPNDQKNGCGSKIVSIFFFLIFFL